MANNRFTWTRPGHAHIPNMDCGPVVVYNWGPA